MSPVYRTLQTGTIQVGRRLGAGGEGKIFQVLDRADLVVKLYHEPISAEKAEKLKILSRLGTERLFNISAWPVDVLLDESNGDVIGFVMKRINEAEEVHSLHSPRSRLQKFPEASWAFLIYTAANVARAVAAVHDHGLIVGDLNPKNILVTKRATIYLLDCDSFQVTAEGRTWRCEAGFPEYTPPELQGRAFREIDRSEEHDYFGLAIVIFQLLFIGRHPFSGRFLGEGEMPLERAISQRRFAYGEDAMTRQMHQPPATLAIEGVSAPIAGMFRRAFLSTAAGDRPRPREWVEPLEALANSLQKCGLHTGHHYFKELARCPWCEIESRARTRLFNFALAGPDGNRPAFRLDEVWKEIENVQAPVTDLVSSNIWVPPVPSPEAIQLAKKRDNHQYYALAFSLILGFCVGLIGDFGMSFWLLVFIGGVARKIADAELFSGERVQTIMPSKRPTSYDPLFEIIQSAKEEAGKAVRELEHQWQTEASNEPFLIKQRELQTQKEAFERLSKIREEKLNRFELAIKNEQRQEFLNRHELKDLELGGIWSTRKESLELHGIATAADVTSQRLKQVPGLGKFHTNKLLEWRTDLERKFSFDPLNFRSQQGRIAIEKEMDAIRTRLQHDLSSGPFYLLRTKQEIEKKREQIEPLLGEARQKLARSEKDFEIASRRNAGWPIVLLLIGAFILGSAVTPYSESHETRKVPQSVPIDPQPEQQASIPKSTYHNEDANISTEDFKTANQLYYEGEELSKQGRYSEAAAAYREAISIYHPLTSAHEGLSYSLYRLQRYDESIEAANEAIRLNHGCLGYYCLGLNYVAKKYWLGAKMAFDYALSSERDSSWDKTYPEAYYYLSLSLTKLGEAKARIEELEHSLQRDPEQGFVRFELATLYLCGGKSKAVETQYQVLNEKAPPLAVELSKLMRKHGLSP